MSSRQRFLETMGHGHPDRVPLFEEGIRADVLTAWREQGLAPEFQLADLFRYDRREEILPMLEPQPYPARWPTQQSELDLLRQRLDPADRSRLPADWEQKVAAWRRRDHPLLLRLHRGLFQTLGIRNWDRFSEVMFLMVDDPDLVREAMAIQADFVCRLAERILQEVQVDAVIFSEPVADNNGPLVSPQMYEELALTSYRPILELVRAHGVEICIIRTYANTRVLIPSLVECGFNCLWACETNPEAMDYAALRRTFGPDLRLIGGIDTDVLRQDRAAIRRHLEEQVPPLLAQGGYIPLADGRIRADIPFEHYRSYRQLLSQVTAA
ncbi:MAG: uroporphyrinogen decarboxylase family protein [Candidatus Promineifilaceae bacterium]|nr:uroporphyrinogen decarboxylase family protein [Candidatus Promineifilaceae bacterium]